MVLFSCHGVQLFKRDTQTKESPAIAPGFLLPVRNKKAPTSSGLLHSGEKREGDA
jgi:hypothetical protein